MPWTGWLKRQISILTVLKVGKSIVKVLVDVVSGRGSLSGSQTPVFFLGPPLVEGASVLL